jgi:hypothetical protein
MAWGRNEGKRRIMTQPLQFSHQKEEEQEEKEEDDNNDDDE